MYSDLLLPTKSNPPPPPLLKPHDNLEEAGETLKRQESLSANVLRRKACSYTNRFTGMFMGPPTQAAKPDRMPQTEVVLPASNRELPPPEMALSDLYIVRTPLLLTNDSICSFAKPTHTQLPTKTNTDNNTIEKNPRKIRSFCPIEKERETKIKHDAIPTKNPFTTNV